MDGRRWGGGAVEGGATHHPSPPVDALGPIPAGSGGGGHAGACVSWIHRWWPCWDLHRPDQGVVAASFSGAMGRREGTVMGIWETWGGEGKEEGDKGVVRRVTWWELRRRGARRGMGRKEVVGERGCGSGG